VFLLNKIKDSGVENYLNGRLAERGIEPVAAIREDPAISQSWMNGASIDATDHQPNIQRVIEKLESAECQSISA